MGSEALSEIDFARLCRRHCLPAPTRQAIRIEPSGRRRYLDAEWRLRDGRRVAVEVDGAVHLAQRKWFEISSGTTNSRSAARSYCDSPASSCEPSRCWSSVNCAAP